MRVLITGGYGCIGSWITKQLLERGHDVWIYDLKEDWRRLDLILQPDQLEQVQFVHGDVDIHHFIGTLEEAVGNLARCLAPVVLRGAHRCGGAPSGVG